MTTADNVIGTTHTARCVGTSCTSIVTFLLLLHFSFHVFIIIIIIEFLTSQL